MNEKSIEVTTIINRLRNFITNSKKSQTEVARSIGISPASLSQFLSGSYKGDSVGIAQKVEMYLQQEAFKMNLPKMPTFTMTETAQKIWYAARYAHANSDISLVYGEAGLGKTIALKEYTKQHVGVVYVEARSCDRSTKGICERILKTIGKKVAGTDRVLVDTIIETLRDSGRLLIIDEAQHLSLKAIESIRSFNDDGNIGILFSGNPTIYDRMYGRGEAHFAQLFSRIGIRRAIPKDPVREDVETIFHDANVSDDCIDVLHALACDKGGLRYMMKIYKIALDIALSQEKPLSVDHLFHAKENKDGE
ncbi:MAG: AAA family ATPase [Clostridiaceae bacterium]|nr:AAA family ATPase [Clostridiaceae bacterium]